MVDINCGSFKSNYPNKFLISIKLLLNEIQWKLFNLSTSTHEHFCNNKVTTFLKHFRFAATIKGKQINIKHQTNSQQQE